MKNYYLKSSVTSLVVASNGIFLTSNLLDIGSLVVDKVFLAVIIVSSLFSVRFEQ